MTKPNLKTIRMPYRASLHHSTFCITVFNNEFAPVTAGGDLHLDPKDAIVYPRIEVPKDVMYSARPFETVGHLRARCTTHTALLNLVETGWAGPGHDVSVIAVCHTSGDMSLFKVVFGDNGEYVIHDDSFSEL